MKLMLKMLILSIVYLILLSVSTLIFPMSEELLKSPFWNNKPSILEFIYVIVNVITISYLTIKSNFSGFKKYLFLLLLIWGIQTFMLQIETLFFIEAFKNLSFTQMIYLFIRPLVLLIVYLPITFIILKNHISKNESSFLILNKIILVKIASCSIIYAVIYILFGYFVAWQFDAIRMFYSNSKEILPFFEHLKIELETKPLLIFQIFRGFLWSILGIIMFKLFSFKKTNMIVISILLFVVLTCIGLIIPNPLMPKDVRMAHLIEMISSMTLFSIILALVYFKKEIKE